MGRIGFICDQQMSSIKEITKTCNLKGLVCEGIFTHFAMSDCGENGESFTKEQYDKFAATVDRLEDQGISFKYTDAAADVIAKESFSHRFGARNMRRYIRSHVEDALAEKIISDYESQITLASLSVQEGQGLVIECV